MTDEADEDRSEERAALENYKCKIGRGYAIEDVGWKHGCDFGRKAERERALRMCEEYCDTPTELTDGYGNARFDEEDFQGDSKSASDLLNYLKQKLSEGA